MRIKSARFKDKSNTLNNEIRTLDEEIAQKQKEIEGPQKEIDENMELLKQRIRGHLYGGRNLHFGYYSGRGGFQ